MKLFKMEIQRGNKGRELLAHAESEEQASALIWAKFSGWSILSCVELPDRPAHFTLAELVDD